MNVLYEGDDQGGRAASVNHRRDDHECRANRDLLKHCGHLFVSRKSDRS
jgi:hypothetical protein